MAAMIVPNHERGILRRQLKGDLVDNIAQPLT